MVFPNEVTRRRYWAERRRRQNQWRGKQKTQPKGQPQEVVLLATSLAEYDELQRLYPDKKVTLEQEQLSLLDKE